MKIYITVILGTILLCYSCENKTKAPAQINTNSKVKVVGAMKDAMWKGELFSKINLDTIRDKKGLYGLGPVTNLTGEIMLFDGQGYVSKVATDTTMTVEKTVATGAPFFVYANVTKWDTIAIPKTVTNMQDLETFIDKNTKTRQRPFAFKVEGGIKDAVIHVQNLPAGSKVSSPEEAHVGQVTYNLINEEVSILGFFSTTHQSIFTHHDTFMHMHLITKDAQKMGHLDAANFSNATLYLPKE